MKLVFIADFFIDEILGGGELNNDELIKIFKQRGHEVISAKSATTNASFIEANKESCFIVANFIMLSDACKKALEDKNYIIYEHDHKYLASRNPAHCKDFKCPENKIINRDFYKNAKAVLCQSQFHNDIVKQNLNIDNVENLGGNLWPIESLVKMREIAEKEKKNRCSILDSNISHKNTAGSIQFCETREYEYELVKSRSYYEFLEKLGANDKFCFFPKTPETLSRVVVEARMMNMGVYINKLIGAATEPWFSLKGEELIDIIENKRNEIPVKIECLL
jgi:hypothetical protein